MSAYVPTIGIECHIQLKTKTKLFAAVNNDARGAAPNTLVSPICFGMPGVLPVLNEAVVDLSIRAGIALNAEIANFSKFDRKHYFYPDLPLGYQITQFDEPIVGKGEVSVPLGDISFKVGITRAHLEADAGKSSHPTGATHSLVDLNRAGTPLLEIVSEPDMHSAKEARAFVKELYYLIKYSGASDVDLYQGNMRFDVNVSLSKPGEPLGTRTETKNLNSFRSVERAVNYEIVRQTKLLDAGETIDQETRGWDEDKNQTFSQRSKEDAHDYRYFPDPDLPPIQIEDSRIQNIRDTMPMLPPQIREILSNAGVEEAKFDTLLDSEKFVELVLTAHEEGVSPKALKRMVNWITVEIQKLIGELDGELMLTFSHLSEVNDMVEAGELSSTAAKEVLIEVATNGGSAKDVANDRNLIQVSDTSEIEAYVDQVIAENPKAVEDIKNGETKVIGFMVGQVMKLSKGQANPGMVNKIIQDKVK